MRATSFSFATIAVAAAAVAIPAATPAAAQARTERSERDITPRAEAPSWHGSYGAGAVVRQRYAGGGEYRAHPIPYLQLEYRGRYFLGMEGLGAHLYRTPSTRVSVALAGWDARKEHRGDALAGMGDRDGSGAIATAASYTLGPVSANGTVLVAMNDDAGTQGSLGLSTQQRFARRWMATVSTAATFANAKQMAYDFGITEQQAAARRTLIAAGDPRLSAAAGSSYAPGGGLKQAQSTLMLGYMATERTSVVMLAQGTRLSSDAARSSIVTERNGGMVALVVARGF